MGLTAALLLLTWMVRKWWNYGQAPAEIIEREPLPARSNACAEKVSSDRFSSLFKKLVDFDEKSFEIVVLEDFHLGEGSSRIRLHKYAVAQTNFYLTDFVILTVSKEHIPPVDLWVYAEDIEGGRVIEVSPFIPTTLERGASRVMRINGDNFSQRNTRISDSSLE